MNMSVYSRQGGRKIVHVYRVLRRAKASDPLLVSLARVLSNSVGRCIHVAALSALVPFQVAAHDVEQILVFKVDRTKIDPLVRPFVCHLIGGIRDASCLRNLVRVWRRTNNRGGGRKRRKRRERRRKRIRRRNDRQQHQRRRH